MASRLEHFVDARALLAHAAPGEGRLRLDARDLVVAVEGDWNALVARGRVASLVPAVVGASFWDSVVGGAAASLLESLLDRARAHVLVTLDAWGAEHDRRTKHELRILAQPAGGLALVLRPLFSHLVPPLPLFAAEAPRSADALPVCGFCQNALAFRWVDPATALRQLRIEPDQPQPVVKPTVCGDCERRIHAAAGFRLSA